MDINKPRFELRSIYSDGSTEEPRIVPINEMPLDTNTNRRGFLGAGLVAGAALNLLGNSKLFGKPNLINKTEENFEDEALYAHEGAITALAITPDGKMLASGSKDNKIKLWSLPEGKFIKSLTSHFDSVFTLAISPDGKVLASGSKDKKIILWSLPQGNFIKILDGHSNSVFTLAISPDGKMLASGSHDQMIKLWSLPDGILIRSFEKQADSISTLSFTPDGTILISRSYNKTTRLWSFPEGNLIQSIKGHSESINALSINPDGKTFAFGAKGNSIEIHSLPSGEFLKTIRGHSKIIHSIYTSHDGKMLASGSWDKTIRLWSLSEANLINTFVGHSDKVFAVVISRDNKLLASGSKDKTIRLWNLEKNEFVGFLFDPFSNKNDGITYNIYDVVTQTTRTYTLPCGSPIPSGAVCTCNCVAGTYKPPPAYSSPSYQNTCTCNKVCTCIPVCQAHKLLHPDKFVRVLSREILLFMGVKEIDYMKWAADNSKTKLKAAITSLIKKIKRGLNPDYPNWPAVAECEEYLQHDDEVISVMAAQMINLQHNFRQQPVSKDIYQTVESLLAKSKKMFWKKKLEHGHK